MNILEKFESVRPFTPSEAWGLFRLAALSEAVGWTLLIIGIVLKQYVLHGNNAPVLLAGRIHGTLFLIYFAASVVLYPSQKWSRWRAAAAVMASVPPYGSLLFEQWEAHRRHSISAGVQCRLATYRLLAARAVTV